ncbi:NUDIX domain-containing protein [Geodermatophilus aquaeductus]|uniref:ADP-ribose pyrophosphatase YjhB, NUDIX family n=1 Tax=Geodermatophilus aquaeductus TaxID=1564161 RepID=A0A521EXP4_9ACTN|nr:NUDIX domain-containing protein [Geodermatophilus aquaeductus]SMO88762.1 ADP-ribose pyrophosphatase YjhB, NUDIX family [Geodermatophilus aquaeductus]
MSTTAYRDASGRRLVDYPRPSVAVDTAVLTPNPSEGLQVLLVRRDSAQRKDAWALPGTFLHEGETLADAVLRSLEQKAGLRGQAPRQLHVFDAPERDDRGWVLSVAHVVLLAADVVRPVVAARPDDVRLRPVEDATGLPFDHDDIVRMAVAEVRSSYAERPDPDRLLLEPFTLRDLRRLHEAVAGERLQPDVFRRHVKDHLVSTGEMTRGSVGRPAELFRHT